MVSDNAEVSATLPGSGSGDVSLSATDPEELDALGGFLRAAFHAPPNAPWLSVDALRWKYFDEQKGPALSYVARRGADTVGHIGLVRRRLDVPDGHRRRTFVGVHFIDWVAIPGAPAVGALLLLRGLSGAHVGYLLGGSEDGKAVSQAAGFASRAGIPIFARVLRPWHRLGVHGRPPWRGLAAGARDLFRQWQARPRPTRAAVSLEPAHAFGDEVPAIVAAATPGLVFSERSAALLNHYLRCPLGEVTGFHVRSGGNLIGFMVLTVVTSRGVRSGRVVDCLVGSDRPDEWRAALGAAVVEFHRQHADVVTCYASTPLMRDACAAAGLRLERLQPFLLRDRAGLIPDAPMHVTHLEADHALF